MSVEMTLFKATAAVAFFMKQFHPIIMGNIVSNRIHEVRSTATNSKGQKTWHTTKSFEVIVASVTSVLGLLR